jgi:hypothetical protein
MLFCLVGAASAATLAPPMTEGSGLWGAPSSVTFGVLKAESSGRKPLLPTKDDVVLVGAALAATLAPPMTEGSGLWGAAFIRGLWGLEGRRFGAKAPPAKKDDVVLVGAASAATLASSKAEGLGLQGAPSSVAFGVLKTESSGLKPLLPKRTVVSSKPWGSGGKPRLGAGEGRPRKDHSGGLGCAA